MGLLRVNNLGDATGLINPITLSTAITTTASWATAPTNMPTVTAPDFLKLVVAPNTTAEEIIYVTAYVAAATTATVLRAQEGSASATHTAVAWVNGGTARDLTTTPIKIVTSAYAMAAADATLLVSNDVSLVDSGPNGSTLVIGGGTVGTVASGEGTAFNEAASFNAGYVLGPAGATNAQGAITGSAFTVEFLFTPLITSVGGKNIVTRSGPNNEWSVLWSGGGFIYYVWNAAGTLVSFSGSHTGLLAGITYSVAMTWNGTTLTGWVNGVSDGSAALANVYAPSGSARFEIGSGDSTTVGIVDEVRVSSTCRYTTGYTPATAPFASDGNTGCLYHLDGGVTLPSPAAVAAGATYRIKSTASPFCLKPNAAETIDGASIFYNNAAYGVIEVVTDGTNWLILSQSKTPATVVTPTVVASVAGLELTSTGQVVVLSYPALAGSYRVSLTGFSNSGSAITLTQVYVQYYFAGITFYHGLNGGLCPGGVFVPANNEVVELSTASLTGSSSFAAVPLMFRSTGLIEIIMEVSVANEIYVWATIEQLTAT